MSEGPNILFFDIEWNYEKKPRVPKVKVPKVPKVKVPRVKKVKHGKPQWKTNGYAKGPLIAAG